MVQAQVLIIFSMALVLAGGCVSAPSQPQSMPSPALPSQSVVNQTPQKRSSASSRPSHFHTDTPRKTAKLLWKRKLNGFITDLDISLDGKRILVATAPDREGGRSQRYQLFFFNASGKQLWRKEIKFPVRTETLTGNGKLVLISDYDDHLIGFNDRGKKQWEAEGMCRPISLDLTGRILCFHDEDTAAGVVFEVFDSYGKKELSFPLPPISSTQQASQRKQINDVLVLKVSQDQKYTTFGLTGGRVFFLGPDHRTVWEQSVDAEITDLAVSDGPEPKIAALLTQVPSGRRDQRIVLWNHLGHRLAATTPKIRLQQINLTPDGLGLIGYGNNPNGQILTSFTTPELNTRWSQEADPYAEYSSKMTIYSSHVAVGFDDRGGQIRHSHLKFFDFAGQLDWDISLLTEEGALLAVYDLSTQSRTLAIGMDDGELKVFRLLDPGTKQAF